MNMVDMGLYLKKYIEYECMVCAIKTYTCTIAAVQVSEL